MQSQHLNQNGRYAILHATYRIIINTKTLTARTAQKNIQIDTNLKNQELNTNVVN